MGTVNRSLRSRREIILCSTSPLVAVLTGCVGDVNLADAPDLKITNESDTQQQVAIRILEHGRGAEVLNEEFALSPGKLKSYDEIDDGNGVRITVTTGNDVSRSFSWADKPDNSRGIYILIYDTHIEIEEYVV